MTDHLEQYRRMARAMRFFPPLSLNQPSQESLSQPVAPTAMADLSLKKTIADAQVSVSVGPPIDPSEHATALIYEAVRKPTVLPTTYSIQENIGDRISRLSATKQTNSLLIQPQIPSPGSYGAFAHRIESQDIEAENSHLIYNADLQAYVPATFVAEPVEVEETPVEEPVEVEETPVEEPVEVEETPAEEPVAIVAEPVEVEETPVEEPVEVEETPAEEPVAVVSQPVEVEETPAEEPVAVVAEPVEVEQTLTEDKKSDAEAPIAEAEETQAPTLLERVSAVVEAVVTTFKGSEAEGESAPAEEEKVSESKTDELSCPKCQSTKLSKNGHSGHKQKYVCKDCGKHFVMDDSASAEDKLNHQKSSQVETTKTAASKLDTDVSASKSESSKSSSKKKPKPKGFGSPKTK